MADFHEIEAALSARVARADASAHAMGDVASLRESSVPLSVLSDAAPLQHLRYSLAIGSAPRDGTSRDGSFGVDGQVYVKADVFLVWAYKLRAEYQQADARRAGALAAAIVRRVCAAPTQAELDAGVDLEVEYVDGYRPGVDPSGLWLLVEQSFIVRFNLGLTE
jgi:hypothetical protein